MGYYIDLEGISIDEYKGILKSTDLIPSWMILKENINENLEIIKKHSIRNLAELLKALKDKDKLFEFSKRSGLSENYLVVLRRVVNGYHPKPNRIKDFLGVTDDVILKLKELGIKNTFQLFDKVLTIRDRKALSDQTDIDENEILRLTKLTDVSRIKWVGYTFAYVLYEANYDTVEKMANADPSELYENVKQLNRERDLYKGHIGLHDMKICIQAAKGLSLDIQY